MTRYFVVGLYGGEKREFCFGKVAIRMIVMHRKYFDFKCENQCKGNYFVEVLVLSEELQTGEGLYK